MNVSSKISYGEKLKEVLLETAIAVGENKKPISIVELDKRLPEVYTSTVYTRVKACVKRGWLQKTETEKGLSAVFPTLKGFRIVGEEPKSVGVPQDEEKVMYDVRYIYAVTIVFEAPSGKVDSKTFYTDKDFKEIMGLLSDREDVLSLYIKRENLV
jgi:hypothetical protein